MERLTTKRKDGRWALKNDDGATPREQINKVPRAIDRLAAYEDTMPLERAQELAQAEKDGRLVVLPCKPGTEIFTHCHVRGAYPIAHGYFYPPYIPTLGENAWLTREEAEAALKKREEADNEAD